MGRNAAQLVEELREAEASADSCALVVGFDARTELVWATDPDALGTLNAHVANGGEPIALLIAYRSGEIRARLLGTGSVSLMTLGSIAKVLERLAADPLESDESNRNRGR